MTHTRYVTTYIKISYTRFWDPYVTSKYTSLGEMYPNDTRRIAFFLKHTLHSKSEKIQEKLRKLEETAHDKISVGSPVPAPPVISFVTRQS